MDNTKLLREQKQANEHRKSTFTIASSVLSAD